jgi:hypothetical protein
LSENDHNLSEFEVALATTPAPESLLPESEESLIRQEVIAQTIAWLVGNGDDATHIGRRALTLAYVMGSETGPQTLTELGIRMGVSESRAHQIMSALKSKDMVFSLFSEENTTTG